MKAERSATLERRCRLLRPIRDRQGRPHFDETPLILREIDNVGRHILLVEFADGSSTFVFPDEIESCDAQSAGWSH